MNFDKYLRIMNWAKARYTNPFTNHLIISIGDRPSRYKQIERLAAEKYLSLKKLNENALTISPNNTLDHQCKKLTGDGYSWIDWEGDLSADPCLIKHVKTGLIVKVL